MFARLKQFFSKWIAFFCPVTGWKKRYLAFKGGQTTWEVPGHPKASKVVPFPVEWIPHRTAGEFDDEATRKRGFEFLPAVCVDSGKEAPIGKGVRCLRCGIPLHESAAHMVSGFDPPYCKRCHWPLLLLGR